MEPIDLSFEWADLTMHGSLHCPSGTGPFPVVLMMQGSGPADRDNDGYFHDIRPAFLRHGIATYSFDKAGCGSTSGDWHDHGLEERASQAEDALQMLRSHELLDADRIGVWGQSQGGWLTQMIAGRNHDLAFAIVNSGPTITVVEQNLYGCEHRLRGLGHSDDEIASALAYVEAVHAAAGRGDAFESIPDPPPVTYMTSDDPRDWGLMVRFVTSTFDPIDSLRQVRCPILAVFGGLDDLVPAWRSARETGAALVEAGNKDATVMVFPTVGHRITDPVTGEYAAGYLNLLGSWAAARAFAS